MLSLVITCQKIDSALLQVIHSIEDLKPQILIDVSDLSTESLGIRKNNLIKIAANDWILILDSDEIVSEKLKNEINSVLRSDRPSIKGYRIPYFNHAFGKHISRGGESYGKVRLFKKIHGKVTINYVHEEIEISEVGELKSYIMHYSYRTINQVIAKFTKYAWQMAGEMRKKHERVTLKKLFMYGPHMVWARAIKDEGWRDGWQGIVIALCFGYMETLMYWLLLLRNMLAR